MADVELEKKKDEGGGAPLWMVTYGDFMTLVLTFFVLLFSMAKIDVTKAIKISNVVRERIGDPVRVLAPRTDIVQSFRINQPSQQPTAARTESFQGTAAAVRSIEEGLKITIKDHVMFDRGSYRIRRGEDNQIVRTLDGIAQFLEGSRNKIDIRGYSSGEIGDTLNIFNLEIQSQAGQSVSVPGFTNPEQYTKLENLKERTESVKIQDDREGIAPTLLNRGERLLGYMRAEAVARYLTKPVESDESSTTEENGDPGIKEPRIKPGRIRLSSGGSTDPRYRGKDKELLKMNRRVEIIVLEKGLE